MSNNDEDKSNIKIETEEVELTPDKLIGIMQEGNERDILTTGNFSLSELKYLRHSFLDYIEEMMLNKLSQEERIAFKKIQEQRENFEHQLYLELFGRKGKVYNKCFAQDDDFVKVFDSRDMPEELQDEVQEFVDDLLSDVAEEDVKALERATEEKEREAEMNEKVINLAEYSSSN